MTATRILRQMPPRLEDLAWIMAVVEAQEVVPDVHLRPATYTGGAWHLRPLRQLLPGCWIVERHWINDRGAEYPPREPADLW